MTREVLCVDDESQVLEGLRRNLRHCCRMRTATSGADALSLIRDCGPFAVIVSDMRMPGMSGVQLLATVKEQSPDTVRILLTGNADVEAAMGAVNRAGIFRFLAKPCPVSDLVEAIEAGIEHHRLVTAEKVLLENTLAGVVRVLTDVLAIASPKVFNRATRLRDIVVRLLESSGHARDWRYELAAHLALIGCIALPPELPELVLSRAPVSAQQLRVFGRHPETGRRLLAAIPRLEVVADIVGHQLTRNVVGIANRDVRRGVELLQLASRIADDTEDGNPADFAITIRQYCETASPAPRACVNGAGETNGPEPHRELFLPAGELCENMTLLEDLVDTLGHVILRRGQQLTILHVALIQNLAESVGRGEPIKVRVP